MTSSIPRLNGETHVDVLARLLEPVIEVVDDPSSGLAQRARETVILAVIHAFHEGLHFDRRSVTPTPHSSRSSSLGDAAPPLLFRQLTDGEQNPSVRPMPRRTTP